jgi:hypothetical protein
MVHVLGVSMPRSGHHFLEMILRNTLGNKFGYCEFYEHGCCKSIPCKSQFQHNFENRELFLQKSHDFDFIDEILLPNAFRVVQYRNPVPRSLSNYELYLQHGFEDNIITFRHFLVAEAIYFCKFYQKWMAKASPKILTLSYEELTADPLRALLRFFQYVRLPMDLDQLASGIAQSVGRRGRDNVAFIPVEVLSHRYAKHPALANFQEIVIRNCPGYFPMRYFSSDDPDNSLIGLIFRAKKAMDAADREQAIALAEAAYVQDRQDPALVRLCDSARSIPAKPGSADPADARRAIAMSESPSPLEIGIFGAGLQGAVR